jgi:hypothetical protein
MNPKTGQVYTVVNQDWGLRRGFKPCSTIKLVTGLAGLNEHVIDPVQTVNIGTSSFSLDLTDSLAYSNNGYYLQRYSFGCDPKLTGYFRLHQQQILNGLLTRSRMRVNPAIKRKVKRDINIPEENLCLMLPGVSRARRAVP